MHNLYWCNGVCSHKMGPLMLLWITIMDLMDGLSKAYVGSKSNDYGVVFKPIYSHFCFYV